MKKQQKGKNSRNEKTVVTKNKRNEKSVETKKQQ